MIRVEKLSFAYRRGLDPVFRDVSFMLQSGKWGILTGREGTGKSTLLSILAGFLFPFEGTVTVEGTVLSPKTAGQVREKIGFALQFPEDQLFCPSVREEVAFGLRMRKVPQKEVQARVCESLARVGLSPDDFVSRSPFKLSLGEKRRVALASLLAFRPSILLLDEPTSGLDPGGRKAFHNLLYRLKQEGTAILMVSHHVEEALPYADDLFCLERGGRLFQVGLSSLLSRDPKDLALPDGVLPRSLDRLLALRSRFPMFQPSGYSLAEIEGALSGLRGITWRR